MTTQSVQVKLELGHKASLRKKLTSEGFTHDWVVFVRGPEGSNIQHFVEKVVFHLHESFPKPKRVVKEPPYSVAESGYGSFNLPIEIYFKTKEEPRKIRFDYDLFLHLNGSPPVNHLRCEKLTFQNPTEDFRRKLIKAGGVGILGPNEFPGVPPSTQATTTPGTPQTSESKAFVELFGSSAHSESTEAKSSDSKDNDQSHVKKKKSSHSKDRDKDREKHKSKSLSATSSSVTNSPLMLSSPQSTPKTTSSPLTSAEKSSKHKHSSKHEGSSDHSGHKKKKKDKDRERSKDHERTKSKEKHRDKVREKEGDKQNEEHNKEKHGTVLQEKEKRKDKGGKTITCAKVELSSKKESEDKEKTKEKERSKHKDGTPVTSSSSSSSKSKGHKRSHRSKEREKAKEPSRSEKDNTSSSFESPSSKRPKPINSPAPITTSQLPLNSDIFSASDYDPFEDDVDADNTSQPPPLQPGPSDPDRSEKPMKSSLLDEMSSDVDMDISDNDDVDPEYPEPLFAESGHSPAKSDIHHSPPQIEPVISNGFSPHENVAPVRPQLSPEKKQLDAISAYKSPSASRRMNERSSAQKEHSVSKWKDSEDERSRRNPTPSPKGSSMVDDVIRRRDEDHVLEGSPLWASSQNTILMAKSSNMSPPRLSMDPPDLLKTTQHGDLLQFEAAQQRVPFLKRENHVEKMSPPNNNQPVKEPSCNELPEPVMKPGYAPNGETFELLLSLQAKLNKTKDEEILSDVVRILEESGEVFAITDASLDFDLCYLNSKTVHKLKHCLHLS